MSATLFDGIKSVRLDDLPPEAWRVIAGDSDTSAEAQRLYETVAFLYRCVEVRANALVALPWAVQRNDSDIWTNADGAAPAELAALSDIPDLLWQTEAAMCLAGEAFWHKIETRARRLLEVRWLSPATIKPVWDADAGLIGYKRALPNRAPQPMSVDEVVHFWLRGMHETKPRRSPAEAASIAARVIYNTDLFTAGFFERGAIKATLLTIDGNPLPAERERIKSWWRRFMAGVKNAFTAEVVAASVKPVVVGDGIGELANTALTAEKREDIATAMGVPHSLVLSNAANYATSQQDELNFYNLTIVPEARLIERQINRQLFEPLGLQFQFRPEELSVYQEDETQRAQAFSLYVGAGIPLGTAAQILGVSLPDGMEYDDLNVAPQPAQPQAEQPTPDVEEADNDNEAVRRVELRRLRRWAKGKRQPDVDKFDSDVLSRADKMAALGLTDTGEAATAHVFFTRELWTPQRWQAYKAMTLQLDPDDDEAEQQARMELERELADNLERELTRQLNTLLPPGTPDDEIDNLVRAAAGRVDETSSGVREVLRRALIEDASLGVAVAFDTLERVGMAFDWTLANTEAAEWARRYSFDLVTRINDHTRTRLGTAVNDWFNARTTLRDLRRELAPLFDNRRAQLIAQTETTRAAAEGARIGFAQTEGINEWEWAAVADERVCPICGGLHGKRAVLGQPFVWNGAQYTPPAHPGCRCFVRAVIA
jgi:SPP1 gp7 family putative phage head morphogenesis protein